MAQLMDHRTSRREDLLAVALGAWLIGGVFIDGWAHSNRGALETFFTPWHGVLYGGAMAAFAFLLWLTYRRRHVPAGYQLAVLGGPVFLVAGGGDFLWHQVFGLETGLDALLSPTHLLLLASGLLVLSGPWRADALRGGPPQAAAVLSLGLTTALVAFFLLYTSAFTTPLAAFPLTTIPHGTPGHIESEMVAVAGLAGYLVTTALLVIPVLVVARHGAPPAGALTAVIVVIVTLSAAVAEFEQPFAPVAAVLAGLAAEKALRLSAGWSPPRRSIAVAVAVPAVLWPAQLLGIQLVQGVGWPVELWSGVVVLSVAVAAMLGWLSTGPRPVSPDPPVQRRAMALTR